jgi:hypothetical protein
MATITETGVHVDRLEIRRTEAGLVALVTGHSVDAQGNRIRALVERDFTASLTPAQRTALTELQEAAAVALHESLAVVGVAEVA